VRSFFAVSLPVGLGVGGVSCRGELAARSCPVLPGLGRAFPALGVTSDGPPVVFFGAHSSAAGPPALPAVPLVPRCPGIAPRHYTLGFAGADHSVRRVQIRRLTIRWLLSASPVLWLWQDALVWCAREEVAWTVRVAGPLSVLSCRRYGVVRVGCGRSWTSQLVEPDFPVDPLAAGRIMMLPGVQRLCFGATEGLSCRLLFLLAVPAALLRL